MPGDAVHFRCDLIEERVAIVTDVVDVEVGTAWQKGDVRIAAR